MVAFGTAVKYWECTKTPGSSGDLHCSKLNSIDDKNCKKCGKERGNGDTAVDKDNRTIGYLTSADEYKPNNATTSNGSNSGGSGGNSTWGSSD